MADEMCNCTRPSRLQLLEVEHHWMQEAVKNQCLQLVQINGAENTADFMKQVLRRLRICEEP